MRQKEFEMFRDRSKYFEDVLLGKEEYPGYTMYCYEHDGHSWKIDEFWPWFDITCVIMDTYDIAGSRRPKARIKSVGAPWHAKGAVYEDCVEYWEIGTCDIGMFPKEFVTEKGEKVFKRRKRYDYDYWAVDYTLTRGNKFLDLFIFPRFRNVFSTEENANAFYEKCMREKRMREELMQNKKQRPGKK
jgi:hypothetical protein